MPREWVAKDLVPGIYADEDTKLVLIHNELVEDRQVLVWAWLRSKGYRVPLGDWVVHRCEPLAEFLDYKWDRTIAFGQSE